MRSRRRAPFPLATRTADSNNIKTKQRKNTIIIIIIIIIVIIVIIILIIVIIIIIIVIIIIIFMLLLLQLLMQIVRSAPPLHRHESKMRQRFPVASLDGQLQGCRKAQTSEVSTAISPRGYAQVSAQEKT